jgi:hypothetical protein
MKRFVVNDYLVSVGGEHHLGWLPENAAEPLPIPVRKLLFDFVIKGDGGYIFEYQSQSGEFINDSWHETLEDAKVHGQQNFGVPMDVWVEENL